MVYKQISDFLNFILIDKPFFFLNLWSIVHFLSGTMMMFLIISFFKKLKKKSFIVLFFLLVFYEVFELTVILSGSNLFRIETNLDIFLDLVIGMLGGLLTYFIMKKMKN